MEPLGSRSQSALFQAGIALLVAFGVVTSSCGRGDARPHHAWKSDYSSESEWLVDSIVRDIAETSSFAGHQTMSDTKVAVDQTGPDASAFRLTVSGPSGRRLSASIAPKDYIWSPSAYEAVATALVAHYGSKIEPLPSRDDDAPLQALLDLRVETLEAENHSTSRALNENPLDPSAHERAALLLIGFSLREAAGGFSDTRLSLCRVTAHLALAKALQGGRLGLAGRYAEAGLLALVLRQRVAVDALSALAAEPGAATPDRKAWTTALTIRATHDWRRPIGTSLLERLEFYRARVELLGDLVPLVDLGPRPEPVADWGRILFQWPLSVEIGNAVAGGAVRAEFDEAGSVWSVREGTILATSTDTRPCCTAPA